MFIFIFYVNNMAVDLENLVCEEVAVNAVIQWLSSSSDKVIFTVIVNSATQQRQRIRVTINALFCVSLPSRHGPIHVFQNR